MAGYMPQDLALHNYFSGVEILKYYGGIFHVNDLDRKIRSLVGEIGFVGWKCGAQTVDDIEWGTKKKNIIGVCSYSSTKITYLVRKF